MAGSWRSVGPAGSFGSDEAISFISGGARRDDITFNNAFILADMMDQARGREIHFGPGVWAFCPMVAAAYSVGGQACIYPPSNTVLRGIPFQTVLQRYVYGMKDPVTNWEIWAPTATFPGGWAAAHLYTPSQSIIVNGHKYTTLAGGTSGAVIPAALGTIFSGSVVDNTVSWLLSDKIWRGPLIDLQGVDHTAQPSNILLHGLVLDGVAGREDATYPITTTIPFLMQGGYNDVTTGSGWDTSSQTVTCGGLANEIEMNQCWVKRARGENIYLGGGTPGNIRIFNCVISDGNADGISSTSNMFAWGNRIFHVTQAVESFGSTFTENYSNNWVDDCFHGIIVGNSAAITSSQTQIVQNNRVKAYHVGIWFIAPVAGRSADNARIINNTVIDCVDVGIDLEGFGADIDNVFVGFNQILCDTRACSTGMTIGSSGNMTDVTIQGNIMKRTLNAVANGFSFSDGISNSLAGAGSTRVRWLDNTIIGKVNTGGAVASTDYSGLWRGNNYEQYDVTSDIETVSTAGTQDIHPHHEHNYPEAAVINTIGILGTIGNATKFEDRQVVQLHCRAGAKSIIVPQSGTTHKMPAPRITHPSVDFRVRLDAGIWVLEKYDLVAGSNAGKVPTANDVVPSFTTINAQAPAIEFYGMTKTTLSSAGATNFDRVSNPWFDQILTVQHGANETFKHNSGAGTIKLTMAGAVDYVPGAAGEVLFKVPSSGTTAIEIGRMLY